MFSEYFILLFIWLSRGESELKITANSTYWEADRVLDGLGEGESEGRAVLGTVI
jgi:hypothetical protein